MKNRFLLIVTLLLIAEVVLSQPLLEKISSLPMVESVEKMKNNKYFKEALVVMFRQPVDHDSPAYGYFSQRIILSHYDYDKPVVFITAGYTGNYAANSKYLNELCPILEANQIFVEHRYFGKSVPEIVDWEHLNVANAAADHHNIVKIFKEIYDGKWVSTGISKGGSTVLYHRTLYPDDVDVSVPYVAPMNFVEEEKRHIGFIKKEVGTPLSRTMVKNFQMEVLKRKRKLLPLFEEFCEENKFTFRTSLKEVYDYCVLEYSFAFWQWGISPDLIPSLNEDDQIIFDHFVDISSPDYFSVEGQEPIKAFFVQAANELGYYAYDARQFKGNMDVKCTKGYVKELFLPDGVDVKFSRVMGKRVKRYIKKDADKILFIYGGWDPWTASGVDIDNDLNILKIVKDGGDHKTRINNLPEKQKEEAISKLKEWLEVAD